MAKFYSVNELCALSLVSTRTLHHYDDIGILKPHHRTSKGHRRYSENDLLKLQQIVTLKFMGFSLQNITRFLQQADVDFITSLKMQEQALTGQIASFQKITRMIRYLINEHDLQHPVDWKIVAQIIEIVKTHELDYQKWREKHLMSEWQLLFDEVKQHIETDPASETGIRIVRKWVDLAAKCYGDDAELKFKLWEAYKAGAMPIGLPNDKEVIAYLTKAYETLTQGAN